jgi:hypothetical protein
MKSHEKNLYGDVWVFYGAFLQKNVDFCVALAVIIYEALINVLKC